MKPETSQKSDINKLFDLLSSKDLLKKEKISIPHIEKMSRRSIIGLSDEILESTKNPNIGSAKSTLTHAASLGLGGGRAEGCVHLECRLDRIDDLSRFALMYSDKVYINNYFCDYQHYSDDELSHLRRMLFDDLYILQKIRLLIDKGFISILTAPGNICPKCLSLHNFDKHIEKQINSEKKSLSKQIVDTCSASIVRDGRHYSLHLTGPEKFIEHGSMYKPLTEPVATEMLRRKIVKDEEYPLKKYQLKKIRLDEDMAERLIKNVSYELASNQVLGTSFLTDRELHISMLMDITENDETKKKNVLALKHLTSIVPFLDELDIKKLMKLRDREGESFIKYRSALNNAINEFKCASGTFTEADAKNMYNDIIRPEIALLDQKVKIAKSDLTDSAKRTAISTVGALSFGIYMGLSPSAIISMAGVLGFSQILKELMGVCDPEKKVREHDLYFLWKAKKLTK
jgi:hypothetical protein